jgi:hypothetical protein
MSCSRGSETLALAHGWGRVRGVLAGESWYERYRRVGPSSCPRPAHTYLTPRSAT